jgi:hypothetical protein
MYGAFAQRVDANRKPLSNWLKTSEIASFNSALAAAPVATTKKKNFF